MKRLLISCSIGWLALLAHAGQQYELSGGWKCRNIAQVTTSGEQLSRTDSPLTNWMPATVPGTVLTTLLDNKLVPDPFYGMNNEKIPDIYVTGRDRYSYWFVRDFNEAKPRGMEQVYLHFRGVNYACDIYLNGVKLNKERHTGMHIRQTYNITAQLATDGRNRLAVVVFPIDPVGNPNGGQGGDGRIAKNVSHQYVAGWDWIQPVRDRNTGIWDKVIVQKTQGVCLRNPHIVTLVPGKRDPEARVQAPATVRATVEIDNPQPKPVHGTLEYNMGGQKVSRAATLQPHTCTELALPDLVLKNPRLWWPHMYGEQALYALTLRFVADNGRVLNDTTLQIGVREISHSWNEHTRSMQFAVNGQKVFIKGGNWIISDAMLRFSPERYDAEIRFHRDMNLNLIRIWGGAIIERPEFYAACDKYGLLVFQDFWFSGDCNGRWVDPMKSEDQWTRRRYPDDHSLSIRSLADMVKMIRNHPSLAIWCGGNEIPPPQDILHALQDSILPTLDGTRCFFSYSNSDSMSYNQIGGNGDGPYTIQNPATFWNTRTFPFNSEVGSVGTGDAESLQRFLPEANQTVPDYERNLIDSVWIYHKDIGYAHYLKPYGPAQTLKAFADRAQLVNYDQYRALAEGFSAHSWDWYTGFIIWKTQNPWTALRGQMYDYYLDVNACLYGLRKGSEALHVMCNPTDGMLYAVNNSFRYYHDLMLSVSVIDMAGNETSVSNLMVDVSPTSVQAEFSVQAAIEKARAAAGTFLRIRLLDARQAVKAENIYWYPDQKGLYSGLQSMKTVALQASVQRTGKHTLSVTLHNPAGNPVAFFNRIALLHAATGQRVLPTFYDDNYLSIVPDDTKTVCLEYTKDTDVQVSVEGWNVPRQVLDLK